MRLRTYTLSCPVRVPPDDDPCEGVIRVEAWPGSPGGHWDPPEPAEVHVIRAACGHLDRLQEERDEDTEALLDQLADGEERDRDPGR